MNLEPLPTEFRPTPALLRYYALQSLVAGPFFWIPLLVMWARYRSMLYRLDEEGISMRWGVLFRREVSLNYGRIQDIHLSSNVVERWMGLGKIQVQTASGSSKAEMTIEGVPDLQAMRDFLYSRMRGARAEGDAGSGAGRADSPRPASQGALRDPELTETLREVAAELRALREDLGRGLPRG